MVKFVCVCLMPFFFLLSFDAIISGEIALDVRDQPLVECLMDSGSLERYHVLVRDEETKKTWIINYCDGKTDVFLEPEDNEEERTYADLDKQREVLAEFEKSAEFVIKILSTRYASERFRMYGNTNYCEFLFFTNFRKGELMNADGSEAFYMSFLSDIETGQIYGFNFSPLTLWQEYSDIVMFIGFTYEDKTPLLDSSGIAVEVSIGDSREDIIEDISLPIYDFGSICVYQDEFANIVVAFDDDSVTCFAGFSPQRKLLFTSDFYPIYGEMIEEYQDKTVQALRSHCGEFHCYLDLEGVKAPAYITHEATIVYFDLNSDKIERIHTIDILTGSVHDLPIIP